MKKYSLALILSAFFCSSTVQPSVFTFLQKPSTVKKIAVASVASAALALLYPKVGRNAGDRWVANFLVTAAGGCFWLRNFLRLRELNKSGVLDAFACRPSAQAAEDRRVLSAYMEKHHLADRNALLGHIVTEVQMFIALAIFYWSQCGVNCYWFKKLEREEKVKAVHQTYNENISRYNDIVDTAADDLKDIGRLDFAGKFLEGYGDYKIDVGSLTDEKLAKITHDIALMINVRKRDDHRLISKESAVRAMTAADKNYANISGKIFNHKNTRPNFKEACVRLEARVQCDYAHMLDFLTTIRDYRQKYASELAEQPPAEGIFF